jgi:hypothetical protein
MPNKRPRNTPTMIKTPFNFELVAHTKNPHRGIKFNNYSVSATFSIPSEEEECPLTLEAISQSKLTFMPDVPFLLDRPQHSKLTLPCGHAFSALTLVYNFCKNNMVCPCCRAGKDVRLDVECLPRHLRSDFKAHIQQVTQQEARDDDESIIHDLISVAGFMSVMPYQVLAANNNLSLHMEFFNIWSPIPLSTGLIPIFTMSTALNVSQNHAAGSPSILQPRGDLRGISNLAHMGVNAVRLSVQLTMRGTGSVVIDATPITQLPRASDENTPRCLSIPGITSVATTHNNGYEVVIQLRGDSNNSEGPATKFCVLFSQSAAYAHLVIQNIMWHPGTETLAIMSNNTGFGTML